MVYMIIESTLLKNAILSSVKKSDDLKIVCTKGMIFKYEWDLNHNISYKPNNVQVYNRLVNLCNSLQPGDEVIVATDHDPAGEQIALECLKIFKNAKRYRNRIDDFLNTKEIVTNVLLADSSQEYFNKKMAKIYLKEALSRYPNLTKRLEILTWLLSTDQSRTISVPANYLNYTSVI